LILFVIMMPDVDYIIQHSHKYTTNKAVDFSTT